VITKMPMKTNRIPRTTQNAIRVTRSPPGLRLDTSITPAATTAITSSRTANPIAASFTDRVYGPAIPDDTPTLRKCIDSSRFGIESHDAPIEDFPKQPSQKDGLGRMCKTHWNQYTAGLARAAKARKAVAGASAEPEPGSSAESEAPAEPEATSPVEPEPATKRKRAKDVPTPVAASQGDAD
jgi:hypothetical protein